MKFTEGNLRTFLEYLPEYRELNPYARKSFFSIKDPYGSVSRFSLHPDAEKSGFIRKSPDARNCTVVPGRREFVKVLLALKASAVFDDPDRHAFMEFLGEYAVLSIKKAFVGPKQGDRQPLKYEVVTSPKWVESFLETPAAEWEAPYVDARTPPQFVQPRTDEILKTLIRFLIKNAGPCTVGQLPGYWSPAELGAALFAGFRYGLIFGALEVETAEPIVGLWPKVMPAVLKAHVKPPDPVTPQETFSTPFVVEDCTAILVACAAEPFRLKDTGELYAKNIRDLSKQLKPMPKWVEEKLTIDAEVRVTVGVSFARTFGFLQTEYGRQSQLTMTDRGKAWLELSAGDRWRSMVDGIWDRKQSVPGFSLAEKTRIGPVLMGVEIRTSLKNPPDFEEEALWVARSLKGESFYSLNEVISYAGISKNPLLELAQSDKRASVSFYSGHVPMSDPAKVRLAWSNVLEFFFIQRLFPCGGIRLGRLEEGLAVALTPAGRYYTSQTHDWPVSDTGGGQVIVQPNFEVTFLGESPLAEAEISRFAERRGAGMGAMFQITKKSIFAAAVAGMTAEKVLDQLDKVCSRELPANVRREIAGWFAQSRSVTFEMAMLIRCQDRETAMKVLGLAKGKTSILNDTVVEYKGSNQERAALSRKLKEAGIRVTMPDPHRF
jgi:hypothetical protein